MSTRAHKLARRRWAAAIGLGAWVLCALAVPGLHQLHHARFGADHQHHPLAGTVSVAQVADGDADLGEHQAFDADLVALELADVAHAGVVAVDCELSALTLVACDPARPTTFADLALTHRHQAPPDAEHGLGSLEHLGVALLTPSAPMLSPPAQPLVVVFETRSSTPHQPAFRRTCPSRAPPI